MGELGINLPGLLTQLISFSILAFLLYKLLYGPIVNMLDQRAKKIKTGLESADNAVKAAASSAVKVEEELAKAKKQARAMFAYSTESVSNLGFWYGFAEILDEYTWFTNYLDRLDAVTASDVQRVAQDVLAKSNRTVGHYIPTAA